MEIIFYLKDTNNQQTIEIGCTVFGFKPKYTCYSEKNKMILWKEELKHVCSVTITAGLSILLLSFKFYFKTPVLRYTTKLMIRFVRYLAETPLLLTKKSFLMYKQSSGHASR